MSESSSVQALIVACIDGDRDRAEMLLSQYDDQQMHDTLVAVLGILDRAIANLAEGHAITKRAVMRSLDIT